MLHSHEKQVLFDRSVSSPQPLGLASIRGLISFEMNSSEPNKSSADSVHCHWQLLDEQ